LAQDTEIDDSIRAQKREALNVEIAELKKTLAPVEEAENRAGMLVSVIADLRDAKGMRLLVPIAFETDIWAEWHGDFGTGSFISRVLDTLRDIVQFGVITEKVPFSEGTSKEARAIPWRKWFVANKEKYGLIYQLPPVGAKPEEPPKPTAPVPEAVPASPLPSPSHPAPPKPAPSSIQSPAPVETPRSWWPVIALLLLIAVALAISLRRRRKGSR
jgi:MYXO-CTERM domain-containing protein